MEADVVRVEELVAQACDLLGQAKGPLSAELEVELECVRALLLDLAGRGVDDETSQTARAVAREITAVLLGPRVSVALQQAA